NGFRPWGSVSKERVEVLRVELGLRGGPVILNHGRIDPKKGIDVLIRAIGLLITGYPDLQVVIAGPDSRSHIHELRKLTTSLGLQHQIVFAGQRNRADLHALLSLADVWALATLSENFGNSLVEAMAAGVPCITTSTVNIVPDAANEGAVLVAERTPESFANAISRLLAKPSLAEYTSRAALAYFNRVDWSSVATSFVDVYERMLARSSHGED
ncbi:MAG: glycosyltransferase family 4 protein, partial [Thermomicrobiales bacterium]